MVAGAPAEGGRPQPIAELLNDPDFPRSAIGKLVDIGGSAGTVVDVVKHSLKVRDRDGTALSYNVHVLRKLYGPPPPELERESPRAEPPPPPPPPPAKPVVKREVITDPDFETQVQAVENFVNRPDFPKCAYGLHLDFRGYVGVVVEIVNRSLKVRSREGATRSYNADGLRRLYGKPAPR